MDNCPWYISARAVRDYIAIRRMRDPEGEGTFAVAEGELMEIAESTVASDRAVKREPSGVLRYRGPKPHRLILFVSDAERSEGDLPQLVRVVAPGGKQ